MRGQPRSFFEELSLAFVATTFQHHPHQYLLPPLLISSSSIFVATTFHPHPHQYILMLHLAINGSSQLLAHIELFVRPALVFGEGARMKAYILGHWP